MSREEDWWVKDYAWDIHKYLLFKEKHRFDWKGKSPQLKKRRCLIDWLELVCDRMHFCTSVKHLAVFLLDAFMDNHTIHEDHLQIVSLGCLTVAVKLEEKDHLIPKNSELNALVGNKYRLSEFVQIEMSVLSFFNWDLLFPTAAHFIDYYALYGVYQTDCDCTSSSSLEIIQIYVRRYIECFLNISLKDITYLKFHPSLIAAACVGAARICMLLNPPWPSPLQQISGYKQCHVKPCMDLFLSVYNKESLKVKKSSKADQISCGSSNSSAVEKTTSNASHVL